MFKSRDTLLKGVDLLPKDLGKKLKEMEEFIKNKKPLECVDILSKSALELGIKQVSTDKKNEKNFFYAQRYFVKEDIKGIRNDPQMLFFLVVKSLVLERLLYVPVEFGDKEVVILTSILQDDT